MLYQLNPNEGATKVYINAHGRSRLPFRTVKEMRGLYPSGDFVIIGEVGGLTRPPAGGDVLLTDDGRRISISARGSLKKPFEWVVGYIPVSRNAYLALIGSVLPAFLRGWIPLRARFPP